ncbi:hypothetical protein HU200_039907 [Digitaria exilis]|uniref:Cytochrome P450 n=1 Tax=Digitaria exilis TaxID=1010633 RepID=A0A835BBR1_9POAL|nr:hypothetical protein HU200_039907 [Digitaria exilis]
MEMMTSTPPLLITSLLLLLLTWLLSRVLKNAGGNHGHRSIPSPPAFPIIGHLHLLKKPLHLSLAALAKRYGGDAAGVLLLRFGAKPVLLVTSPSIADECFTVHDVALANRPGLASRRLLTDDCPSISTSNYGELWRHLRRLATVHALSAHRLAATASARDAGARAMAAKLYRAGEASTVSVKAMAYEFVANVIMAMVAGEGMAEDEVVGFKEMTEAGIAAAGAANRLDFLPEVMRMMDFGRMAKRLAEVGKARQQFGQSLVDDYRRRHAHGGGRGGSDEEGTKTPARTVLGDLLRQQREGSPEQLDDVVIRTVCLVSHTVTVTSL